ncbi:MAG: hypothetical protein HY673_03785 [Chloroflexi bacterium]|nr:hypothetical protein [Chloroflexota bacterium]
METTTQTYAIDIGWFEKNNMSFPETAVKRLCASCARKLSAAKKKNPEELIKAISDCCGKEKDFIHGQQPVIESIFRLFLSTQNKPLPVQDIMQKVNEKRPENPLTLSLEALQQMLDGAKYLGLGPVNGG